MKKIVLVLILLLSVILLPSCSGSFDETDLGNVYAQICFNTGDKINFKLYYDKAPDTVQNFIDLVQDDYYDGLIIHRVETSLFQTGKYSYKNKQLYTREDTDPIYGEFRANGWSKNYSIHHVLGTISMARTSDYNTATSQFFVCAETLEDNDGYYAAFGTTTDEKSNNVILKICSTSTYQLNSLMPTFPEKIYRITKIRLSNKPF